jgi:hypothetical protein
MNVRVCGPNLFDQSKGTFHVHADGCQDLRKYGPEYKGKDAKGGDLNGNRGMLIEDATFDKVVTETYADQIAEDPLGDWEDYFRDFWFAPCCYDALLESQRQADTASPVLEGEVSNLVYECWVAEDKGSFSKLKLSGDDRLPLVDWLIGSLRNHNRPGAHIHIVVHDEKEYEPTDDHIMNYPFDR